MRTPIIVTAAASEGLSATPITPGWVLAGSPEARARSVVMSDDRISHVMAWDCTPGRFEWHYGEEDEIVYILAGEVFISVAGQPERRLGAGDVAVFPAGCTCTWRVTEPVRKIAVLCKRIPGPVAIGIRLWHRLMRPFRQAGGFSAVGRAADGARAPG